MRLQNRVAKAALRRESVDVSVPYSCFECGSLIREVVGSEIVLVYACIATCGEGRQLNWCHNVSAEASHAWAPGETAEVPLAHCLCPVPGYCRSLQVLGYRAKKTGIC
ncbi:hypothetical protein COCON_G00174580 [Conger conger]|uniref:Uncharacterized protein n=1 Tax=Conger conger TaxID=82655 RepID=A0A9Q1HSN7_CONCO|nr:hypothetical protein COCON_G00174580 [Conger conger]